MPFLLLFDEGDNTGPPEERKNMDGRMAMRPCELHRRCSAFGESTLRMMRAATGGRPYKNPVGGRLDFLSNAFTPTLPSPVQGGGGRDSRRAHGNAPLRFLLKEEPVRSGNAPYINLYIIG